MWDETTLQNEDEDEYDMVMGVEAESVAMGVQEDYPALKKWRKEAVRKHKELME